VLLDLLEAPVGQQWIFSLFSIVSAMIGLGERMPCLRHGREQQPGLLP
jgi:hypothetical protein